MTTREVVVGGSCLGDRLMRLFLARVKERPQHKAV